jgi:hypothetical protein
VADAPLGEAGQCLRDLGERAEDSLQRRLREGIGNRRGDGHREPSAVGAAWVLGQVRVEQRQDPGEVAEALEEFDFLDEAAVRLALRLGRVDHLESDVFTTITRRAPHSRIPTSAELLTRRPGADRVAGGSDAIRICRISHAEP